MSVPKKNKTFIKIILSAAFVLCLAVFWQADFCWAQVETGIEYAESTGLGNVDPRIVIARVIRIFLGFLGIIAVGLIMYGGWLWMTSEGEEQQISKAKDILKNAFIGLIIILSAFAIASYVLNALVDATAGRNSGGGQPAGGGGSLGSSGNKVIESHYPERNQADVPRNTKIVITFKEPMNADDLVDNGRMNVNNIIIYRTADGIGGPRVTAADAAMTEDLKTVRFSLDEYLGSPSEEIWYTVALSSGIRKSNGDRAFSGTVGEVGYDWKFEVSTIVDIEPPRVIEAIPYPATTEPRNVVVQINFNEAIDPISASGPTASFNNIEVRNLTSSSEIVAGIFYISNQYRTVEFLTEDACGVNSCGDTVYCLPSSSNLSVLAKAATLVDPAASFASFPYNGVVDMADNSLDGNKNGSAQGPEAQSGLEPYNENSPDPAVQGDDYIWSFFTNNIIDISAPEILSIGPASGGVNAAADARPEAMFNKLLLSASLTKDSSYGSGSVGLFNIPANPAAVPYYEIAKINNSITRRTTVYISHDDFLEDARYSAEFNSGIKDIYQNCYSPSGGPGCIPNPPAEPYCCDGAPSAARCAGWQ